MARFHIASHVEEWDLLLRRGSHSQLFHSTPGASVCSWTDEELPPPSETQKRAAPKQRHPGSSGRAARPKVRAGK
jgi:hypothetical protein